MTALAFGIISALTAILLAAIGWLTYRETHRGNVEAADVAKIKAIIQAELQPLAQQIHDNTTKLNTLSDRQQEMQKDTQQLHSRLGGVLDRVAVLETKMEVFWKSVAMDAAKIIHSPDPRRRQVDRLIEAFQHAADGQGMMSGDEYNQLREKLLFIRDWEPGMNSDFPIYPGEQFAAAVLLRTMDHALAASKKKK